MHKRRGFTLIELLIVIAIIGVLSAVVIGATDTSRSKARDTRRLADMKEIQLGLALYYDVYKVYPVALSTLTATGQGFLPSIPTDPKDASNYEYLPSVTFKSYCVGVKLEGTIPNDNDGCASKSSGQTANYTAKR